MSDMNQTFATPTAVNVTIKSSFHRNSNFNAYALTVDNELYLFSAKSELISVDGTPTRLMLEAEIKRRQRRLNKALNVVLDQAEKFVITF